jgi:hypothetical protein
MSERRKSPRVRALKGGKIAFNQHRSIIDCVVRNLTRDGAMLKVPSTVGIPERFEFRFEADGGYRPCHVVWRRPDMLGIAFD